MSKVRLSPAAERDLVDIWLHIASSSGPTTADQWLNRIEGRFDQLAAFPELGPVKSDIAPQARVLVISRWLVLYRIIPSGIRVNRIIDAARDLRTLGSINDETS